MSEHPRRDKRYPARQQLKVRCSTWAEFAQLYATDVSRGGMFIATSDPPAILSEVELLLQLPEGHEIVLRASVVHVIDAETAAREGRKPGVGVQFMELDPIRKQQIHQLVEYARWEGSADRPTSTLASRMFEASASLPPSRVLESLPAEPAERRASTPASSRRPRRSENDTPPPPPKAPDPAKLKLGMTHLAHKRFDDAIKTFEAMLKDNPADQKAQQWLHIARARVCLKRGDEAAAAEHYKKALDAGEDNHEARKFVREYSTRKRLNSLPFGRYFVKKS